MLAVPVVVEGEQFQTNARAVEAASDPPPPSDSHQFQTNARAVEAFGGSSASYG